MTALPSFVDLMVSLGLDSIPVSAKISPTSSPKLSVTAASPTRSRSSPALHEQSRRVVRYSPYIPARSSSRRASFSASSLIPERSDQNSMRGVSASPRLQSNRLRKRSDAEACDSPSAANTPISSYVRRKTPGPSPTSPAFPPSPKFDHCDADMPLTLPTLPPLFPKIPTDADSVPSSPVALPMPPSDYLDVAPFTRRRRHAEFVSIRISTQTRPTVTTSDYPHHY